MSRIWDYITGILAGYTACAVRPTEDPEWHLLWVYGAAATLCCGWSACRSMVRRIRA